MADPTRLHSSVKHLLQVVLCTLALLLPVFGAVGEEWLQGRWAEAESGTTAYIPLVLRTRPSDTCEPVSTTGYGTRPIAAPDLERPAEAHADKNLALRGYEKTTGSLGLIDYSGASDPRAPQLRYLFADQRQAQFSAVYQVYQWDWGCNCRGLLIQKPPVTLAALVTSPEEPVYTPHSGYDIGEGYQALVLYASPERLTLKFTAEDSVVYGYTLHLEGLCVDPALLALYRRCDAEGRQFLPALRGGEPIGRARTTELGVAIRDAGTFMDPRSRKDWWQNP
jgi:hypothetical protein